MCERGRGRTASLQLRCPPECLQSFGEAQRSRYGSREGIRGGAEGRRKPGRRIRLSAVTAGTGSDVGSDSGGKIAGTLQEMLCARIVVWLTLSLTEVGLQDCLSGGAKRAQVPGIGVEAVDAVNRHARGGEYPEFGPQARQRYPGQVHPRSLIKACSVWNGPQHDASAPRAGGGPFSLAPARWASRRARRAKGRRCQLALYERPSQASYCTIFQMCTR